MGARERSGAGPVELTVLVASAYGVLAWLGYQSAFGDTGAEAAAVWPAIGLALPLLVLVGRRCVPGIVLGGIAADLATGATVPTAIAIGLASVVSAAVVAELMRELDVRPGLAHVHDVLGFGALALLVTPIGATLGTGAISLGGAGAHLGLSWLAWWLGDVVGLLVVAVWVLAFLHRRAAPASVAGTGEQLAMLFGTVAVAGLVFSTTVPVFWAVIPLMVWAAGRAPLLLVATANVVVTAIAIAATSAGVGPFGELDATSALVALDGFLVSVTIAGLTIAAFSGGRRAAVDALTQINGELEERIAARTLELAEARDAAEARERAEATFLANMAHELRTPLNAVIGTSRVLADTRLPEEQADLVALIRTSGEHMLAITNDVLDMSKIEAGAITLEDVPFGLRAAMEESLALMGPQALAKGLELVLLEEPGTIDAVVGDVARLRQVLLNLLGNAVKFTAAGEVVVTYATEPVPGSRLRLRVRVDDTGPGIPDEALGRLFGRFEQAERSTSRRYGGTGLGLAISRALVELMQGEIDVASEVGVGTTFTFTVQLDVGIAPETADAGRPFRGQVARVTAVNHRMAEQLGRDLAALGFDAVHDGAADVVVGDLPQEGAPFVALVTPETPTGDDAAARVLKPVRRPALERALRSVLEAIPDEVRRGRRRQLDAGLGERHPLRILLADDATTNQLVGRKLLERLGYRAELAADGVEALEALARADYDVVLMDVDMPRLDGLSATRRIVAGATSSRRPVVLGVSAGATDRERAACLAAGMDGVLGKPLVAERLTEALMQVPSAAPTASAA